MRALACALVLLSACSAARSPDADAGSADAGALDAASADAGALNAPSTDAGALDCNADAMRFAGIASGPLEEGLFCDVIYVCPADAAEEARIIAASSAFECADDDSECAGGRSCQYAPRDTLDAAGLAEICAVTLVMPTPDIVCLTLGP